MQSPFWEVRLNVRSGLVSGLLEVIAILICAPLITRATTKVYNALTTRRVLQGTPVKIRDNSFSVEDIIPRVIRVIRTASTRNPQVPSHIETPFADVTRQLLPLFISVVMSVAIILTSTFIDGAEVPIYTTGNVFLWNGGMFVDTTSTGVDFTAGDIFGMGGIRRACVERVNRETFNLHAVAFSERQDFSTDRIANASVCVNGRDTKQIIGVTIATYTFLELPNIDLESMVKMIEGAPANFTFLEYIRRTFKDDFCHVRVFTNGSSTDWTFSSQVHGMRFATRATVGANGVINLRAGVAYRNLDGLERWATVPRTDCDNIATELFVPYIFKATITPIGIQQDLRQLELVVLDMLLPLSFLADKGVEWQEIMFRSYYAGASSLRVDRRKPSQKTFGTFVPRQIEKTNGTKQITTISGVAVIGFVITIVGCFISFLVLIFVRPSVRLTSVSYISRLYSGRDAEKQDSNVMSGEVEYIGTEQSLLYDRICVRNAGASEEGLRSRTLEIAGTR